MTIKTFRQCLQQFALCIGALLSPLLCAGVGGAWLVSCSESDEDEGEFSNWQVRNEAYFASLEDSLKAQPTVWKKFKSYTLDENSVG